jgi:hypothetical protein
MNKIYILTSAILVVCLGEFFVLNKKLNKTNLLISNTKQFDQKKEEVEVTAILCDRKKNYKINPIYRENCISCGSDDLKKYKCVMADFIKYYVFGGKDHSSNGNKCSKCGMIFSDIAYTDEQMSILYYDYRGSDYVTLRNFYEPGYVYLNNYLKSSHDDDEARKVNIIKVLDENNINYQSSFETVLDYGGDRGQKIPSQFKGEKFVYEISDVKTEAGVKSVSNLEGKSFDFIMCMHVLEHLAFPGKVLQEIKKCMKKDSILYLELPFEMVVEDIEKNNSNFQFVAHEHINFFTPKSTVSILECNGFKTIYCDYRVINVKGHDIKIISALAKVN